MRVSRGAFARLFGAAACLALAALVLGGCTPTGGSSARVVPKEQQLLPGLQDYRNVTVVPGITYETIAGTVLKLDFSPYVLSYLGCDTFSSCPQARRASPLYHVDRSDPPFFVGHSTQERIPLSQSTRFVSRLRSVGVDVTFVTVEGQDHSIAMLDAQMRQRIADFFHATLTHGPFGQRNK